MFYLARGVVAMFLLVSALTSCNGLQQKSPSTDLAHEIIEEEIEQVDDQMAHLTVATVPDARVRILNIKPKYTDNIYLAYGEYLVEVSKPGFATEKRWISLQYDKVINITLTQAAPEEKSKDENSLEGQETVPYICSYYCVISMNSPRGETQTVVTNALNRADAKSEVEQYVTDSCEKYPFYDTSEGTASVGEISCKKAKAGMHSTSLSDVSGSEIYPVEMETTPKKSVDKNSQKKVLFKADDQAAKRAVSSKIVKVENYSCSFFCVGSMNAIRGEKQIIPVTATDVWGAEAGVKQASKAVCKKYPLYETGEGSALVKSLICKKSSL